MNHATVRVPDKRVELIPRHQCIELLRSKGVGRLAVVVEERPKVFPVNYVADADGTVIFRTAPGTKLFGAAMRWVAFEVDELDDIAQAGWSVVVEGIGQDITHAIDHRSVARRLIAAEPWVPGVKANWIEILPRSISGRRVGVVPAAS